MDFHKRVVGDVSAHVVKSIIGGPLRHKKWALHLNALKVEILFEIVYPLWRELYPDATMVSLKLEWTIQPPPEITQAIVRVVSSPLKGPQLNYVAEFIVWHSRGSLEQVTAFYQPVDADKWSFQHVDFIPEN